MSRDQYQQAFDELAAQGFAPVQVSGYRVNVDVLFAAIWERQSGVAWEVRHGMTASAYQKKFDEMVAGGFRLAWISGYSDTGIARYAAIWRKEPSGPWQARHGLDAAAYQRAFDELSSQGFRPAGSGYGNGFYPA
jgi:DNA-binding transcriptional regulator of glucitol operon